MSYTALYRKWRPLVFENVVEQEHVVKTLRNAVMSDRIAHAYLFCGTRGTGKTTMAKIFSRAINCMNPRNGDPCNECEICKGILSGNILDVVEIDAASNNSVDNVREIRDEVIYAPSQAKYKVYIIDEVHMLSTGAFNALLKTLEEPPAHVVFILATTEPHKLPATILSRCQRFDFRRITIESIMDRLDKIAQAGGVSIHRDALKLVARMADGAMRDAISILDQCISMGSAEVSYNDVLSVVGTVNDQFISDVVDAIGTRDISNLIRMIDRLVMDGMDIAHFISDLVLYYRNLMICKMTGSPEDIVEASPETLDKMKKQSAFFGQDEIISIIKELSSLEADLKWVSHPRILLEVSLIKLCEREAAAVDGSILDRLAALEKRLENGDFTVKAAPKEESGNNEISKAGKAIPAVEQKSHPVHADSSVKTGEFKGKTLDFWNEILSGIKSSGKVALYTHLIGTKAVELDSRIIGIVLGEGAGFGKMLLSKAENVEILETEIGKRLGREIRVKCVDEEELSRTESKKLVEEKDELLERAQELANKLNVPLNVIDE